MPVHTTTPDHAPCPSALERMLSAFTDVRPGEGFTAVLMLLNIFLLLVCYSVIKTVREPLILLGGGAEVRSYAAAGQAVLLMAFVPFYSWFAAKVDRLRLIAGVTVFFIACIELFAAAVAARVPYVGVAFFIWVGMFNMSLVAQFWSFANDIYSKEAGDRLFPIVVIGMTAGAPLGSLVAARLFRAGVSPQVILQVSAALLGVSLALYGWINRCATGRIRTVQPRLAGANGFGLVFDNPRLQLIALLVILLNVVNTTGEYLMARLLTDHVNHLAAGTPEFNKQAFLGSFSGEYQFWVNIGAFVLQAFVASRLVKYAGLAGALLALPLIALGGYGIISAGVGFTVLRWIKTAENATDYSIMNTARQLLWLPMTREEKYTAKQAIDAFFVRTGDVLSAGVVYLGASVLHLGVPRFAVVNVTLTLAWIGVALAILRPSAARPRVALRPIAAAAAVLLAVVALPQTAFAQETREERLAADRAEKAASLQPYVLTPIEQRAAHAERAIDLFTTATVYPFVGSVFDGGGVAAGPGVRKFFGDTGKIDAHAAFSARGARGVQGSVLFPAFARDRITVDAGGRFIDAPKVPFYGIGMSSGARRQQFAYRETTIGVSSRVRATRSLSFGGGADLVQFKDGDPVPGTAAGITPNYTRTRLFAEYDTRTSPGYTRKGSFFRAELSDYRQRNDGTSSFRRVDTEAQHFIPLLRENWVIALRALASTTTTSVGNEVPFFLLPDLGHETLRGYPSWRFRDRNRLLLSGEYRWTAGSFVDMALFLDAGQVARRLEEFSAQTFTKTYGISMSFHTPTSTPLRVALARTPEGTSLMFAVGPSF
jgi:AAA family ATP:ADP antiporter